MGRIRFDWRWVALIGFVALLANANRLPWQAIALALGGAGAYVVTIGWRAWKRSRGAPRTWTTRPDARAASTAGPPRPSTMSSGTASSRGIAEASSTTWRSAPPGSRTGRT